MARRHLAFTLLLAVAVALRVAVAVAYEPAIFFFDSQLYVDLALTDPIGVAAERPSGYPVLLKLFSLDGRSLAAVTAAQHVAGIVTGVLVYALLLRLEVRRGLAAAAAAIVLLDGYAIALEQFILAEAFFTLAVLGSLFLAVVAARPPSAVRPTFLLAASGALLAAAIAIRPVAMFALPVWLAYLVWTRAPRGAAALGLAALVLPLVAYAAGFKSQSGEYGLTQADGWFLYARVAEIADCDGVRVSPEARRLCEPDPGSRGRGAAHYLWSPYSPARRLYGGIRVPGEEQARSNEVLRAFAMDVIRARPGRYAELVAADFLRYFRPGTMSGGNSDQGLLLGLPKPRPVASSSRSGTNITPPRPGTAAHALRRYQDLVHTPRWLLGPLALLALAALALPLMARGRGPSARRREILLLAGSGLAMLAGSVATSEFIVRYLIPIVPLLVCGGTVALADLARYARPRRAAVPQPA